MLEPTPVTYRMLYETANGGPLLERFYYVHNIDPNAIVKCNCNFDEGHETTCDLVKANTLIIKLTKHCERSEQ